MYIFRLEAYDRNQNFKGPIVSLPCDEIPNWPATGFKQLQLEHRAVFPKISTDHLEAYFIHRLATDKQESGDAKAIEKGKQLIQSNRVKACSVHMTRQDIYLTGIVSAAMKTKVTYNYKLRFHGQTGDIINSHCECPAGKGPHGTCKHIAAVVLLMDKFVHEGELNVAKSCTETLQTFHRPQKNYSGSPMKAKNIPILKRSKAEDPDDNDDPRPRKYRKMEGYPDYFRNMLHNHEANHQHGLGARFLFKRPTYNRLRMITATPKNLFSKMQLTLNCESAQRRLKTLKGLLSNSRNRSCGTKRESGE